MNEQSKSSGSWIKIPVIAVILLVLYFLSIGPAYWIMFNILPERHLKTVNDVFLNVYMPVGWICELSGPFNELLVWYIGLWIDMGI